jgi:hypothetical protein
LADVKILLHEIAEFRKVFVGPEIKIHCIVSRATVKVLFLVTQVVACASIQILLAKFYYRLSTLAASATLRIWTSGPG